jgi:hypothetical protein
MNEIPLNVLGAFAKKFGFKGNPVTENEKLRDHIVAVALKRLKRPLPTTTPDLINAIENLP